MKTLSSGQVLTNVFNISLHDVILCGTNLQELVPRALPQWREPDHLEPCLLLLLLPNLHVGFSDHTALAIRWSLCQGNQ